MEIDKYVVNKYRCIFAMQTYFFQCTNLEHLHFYYVFEWGVLGPTHLILLYFPMPYGIELFRTSLNVSIMIHDIEIHSSMQKHSTT